MARGRKPSPYSLRKKIVIRMQDAEFNAVKLYAENNGMTVSAFLRKVALEELERNNAPTTAETTNPNQLSIE